LSAGAAAGIGIGFALVVILAFVGALLLFLRRRRRSSDGGPGVPKDAEPADRATYVGTGHDSAVFSRQSARTSTMPSPAVGQTGPSELP
jgi:hypothetical protein